MNININTETERKELEKYALATFKQTARNSIQEHFQNSVRYSPDIPGKTIKLEGPGTLEINETLAKFFDDPKTLQRMDKFFNENFDRIMEETMTKALQHHCNRLIFSRTRNKAKETKIKDDVLFIENTDKKL